MDAGWQTRVSQVPSETARTHNCSRSINFFPAGNPSFNSKLSMAPGCSFVCGQWHNQDVMLIRDNSPLTLPDAAPEKWQYAWHYHNAAACAIQVFSCPSSADRHQRHCYSSQQACNFSDMLLHFLHISSHQSAAYGRSMSV